MFDSTSWVSRLVRASHAREQMLAVAGKGKVVDGAVRAAPDFDLLELIEVDQLLVAPFLDVVDCDRPRPLEGQVESRAVR